MLINDGRLTQFLRPSSICCELPGWQIYFEAYVADQTQRRRDEKRKALRCHRRCAQMVFRVFKPLAAPLRMDDDTVKAVPALLKGIAAQVDGFSGREVLPSP